MENTLEPRTDSESTHALDPLVQQAINNNSEALDELFTRYRERLYKTARRVMGNSNEVEDALQDGLLSAFRNLSGFKGRSQFSTWLTSVVINAALMRLRRIRREAITSSIDHELRSEEGPLANRILDSRPNPEEMYTRQERVEILEQALLGLPAPYRQPLWLCHFQGMSIKEAADALGIPIGSLKSQLHRARLRLSEQLAEAALRKGSFNPVEVTLR
jgi:RNA polymerase sigma-70 factor, ECF subfamily